MGLKGLTSTWRLMRWPQMGSDGSSGSLRGGGQWQEARNQCEQYDFQKWKCENSSSCSEPLRAAPFGKLSRFRAASHNMTQLAYKNSSVARLLAWSWAGGNTSTMHYSTAAQPEPHHAPHTFHVLGQSYCTCTSSRGHGSRSGLPKFSSELLQRTENHRTEPKVQSSSVLVPAFNHRFWFTVQKFSNFWEPGLNQFELNYITKKIHKFLYRIEWITGYF